MTQEATFHWNSYIAAPGNDLEKQQFLYIYFKSGILQS